MNEEQESPDDDEPDDEGEMTWETEAHGAIERAVEHVAFDEVRVRAFKKAEVGTLLTLVECKRYAPSRKVAVDIVRGLYGVVESERATRGIVATTSTFSRDAKSFQAKNEFRLGLADFDILKNWLRDYSQGSSY